MPLTQGPDPADSLSSRVNRNSEPPRVTTNHDREFIRSTTAFRDWISSDSGADFGPEAGRYHLYVSYACPWAHRTLIVRALKGLEAAVGVSVVHPHVGTDGWHFTSVDDDAETADDLYAASHLREFYDRSAPTARYAGPISVPVLWDRQRETIVNNTSADIIRMLNSELNAFARDPELDLYPTELRAEIDELNSWIYPSINSGVYRAGFAETQAAYERAYHELFAALDRVEERLSQHRYLTGNLLTEADIRLFTTLLRFDPVYHNHFRCNKRKLETYPNTWGYTREIAQLPGVTPTIRLDHIKTHYYQSHTSLNPSQIVPVGPDYDLSAPHGRGD